MAYENLFHAQVADGILLISSDASGPNENGRSLLDRKTGVLLSGDTGARRLLYATSDFVPLDVFADILRRLKAYPFDVMYSAHDRCALPKTHIDLMLQVIEQDTQTTEPNLLDIPGICRLALWQRGEMDQIAYFDFSMPDTVWESLQ